RLVGLPHQGELTRLGVRHGRHLRSGTSVSPTQVFPPNGSPACMLSIATPSTPANCTHAITWLGSFGPDAHHSGVPPVIDSTGNAPDHYDSSNRVIPPGVHVRPFGAPGTANDWYFLHVEHLLRIIAG